MHHRNILKFATPSRSWLGFCLSLAMFANAGAAFAQTNAVVTYTPTPGSLPDAGTSVVHVFGALILVIAIFLGGVWLFRNWQRLTLRKRGAPRLNVIEVKSLGQRQTIYVVGYDQQRMLLASSPAGITLISHLPTSEDEPAAVETARPSFADAFRQVLSRKP